MAEENAITTVFKADISQFSASTQQLNQYVRAVNSQFEAATAGMGKWSDNADGLRAKITQLNGVLEADKKKLADLTAQYKKMEDAGEGNSYQANQLKIAINKQIATIKKTEKQTDDYTQALKELDEAGVKTKKELDALTASQEKQGNSAGAVAGKLAKGLGIGMAAVGTAAVAAGKKMWDFANDVSASGDEIDKESQKLSISAESYQKLSYAMERSGADINDVSKGIKTITKEMADVENGVDGAGASFEKLGVSMKNADGSMKSTEQVLMDSIDALANMENETQRNALAQEIFGRSASELNPLLNSGGEAIKQLMQECEDYGMVMSDDAVLASASFQDALTKLNGTMSGVKNNLVGAMLPSLTLITDGFTDMMAGVDGGGEKMRQGMTDLVSRITEATPKLMEMVTTIAHAFLESAPSILKALADGIIEAVPTLIPVIVDVTSQLIQVLVELAPKLIEAVAQICSQLGATLSEQLPILIPIIIDGVMNLAGAILDNLDLIIDAAISIIMALADGLISALPQLIAKAPVIIDKLVQAFTQNMPKIIQAGIELTIKLAEGLVQAIPQLISALPEIIMSIVRGLLECIPELVKCGGELLKGLFKGLLNPKVIWENIKKLGNSILDGVKKFFGIKSPSKMFENQIGKNLALGIASGFDKEMPDVTRDMNAALKTLTPSLQVDPVLTPLGGGGGWIDRLADLMDARQGTVVNNYSFDYKFERVQTSRIALHQAQLETKRIVTGG